MPDQDDDKTKGQKLKPGQATQSQIDAWKKKYPAGLYEFEVDGHYCYLRQPDRQILGLANKLGAGGDSVKFNSIVFDNCWIGGDEAIKTDDRLYMGALREIGEVIEIAEAKVKKL